MVTIEYNGSDLFNGLAPTPYVARQNQMVQVGERWCQGSVLSLHGELTGECLTFAERVAQQRTLLNRLNKDFQHLAIKENGSDVYTEDYVVVRNVEFPQANYANSVPFVITLFCYPVDLFSGTFGVLNPSHQVTFDMTADGLVQVTNVISAKGFNTSSSFSNALNNARTFVQSLSGRAFGITPVYADLGATPTGRLLLKSQVEQIDRFNASYSLTEQYVIDPSGTDATVLRYTVSLSSGYKEGITTVSLRGSIDAGLDGTMADARTAYSSLDLRLIAETAYVGLYGFSGLNSGYLSSGVEENPFAHKLQFNTEFDDDPSPITSFEYRSTVTTDEITQMSRITLDGTVRGRGDIRNRWTRVQDYYATLDVPLLVGQIYSGEVTGFPLNPVPESSGVSFNSFVGEIGVNLTYNNQPLPPSGLDLLEYTIGITPALQQYVSKPLLSGVNPSGEYLVFDLGYATRLQLSVNGRAIVAPNLTEQEGVDVIRDFLNDQLALYITGNRQLLEKFTTGHTNQGPSYNSGTAKDLTFEAVWSCEDTAFTV